MVKLIWTGRAVWSVFGVLILMLDARAQVPAFNREALIETFVQHDAGMNDGKGYSESSDSGRLGWAESRFLDAYVKLYRLTKDTQWLDRIEQHFDRMAANMSDHDGDGFPGWQTDRYSVSRMRASALHNRGTAKVVPEAARERNVERAHQARDAEYIVEQMGGNSIQVTDATQWEVVYSGLYRPGEKIEGIAGFEVQIEGEAKPGDKFRVETRAVEPLEYIVHEGMVLQPVAQFIEIVLTDPKLEGRYGEKARAYLKLIEERFLEKEERFWLQMSPGQGAYRFRDVETERFPNRILPHNQYLALARAYLILKDVSDNPLYLERVTQMARYFKANLRETGDAYTWNYWDWVEAGEMRSTRVEDTGHGSIDVMFAVEAADRGVVFEEADLKRFAQTLTQQMWNGSMQEPVIGGRVDRREGDAKAIRGWVDLSRWDPKVWDLYWALFNRLDRPVMEIPSIVYARAVLDGEIEP